jgi:hypothetical protein
MDTEVTRGRRRASEAARDREWLRSIGRFRFVTAELLAERFGVSVQQANARVRRLAAAGLVARTAGGVGQAYAVSLTRRGARYVGLPERRAPRTDAQREHELAIVGLVGTLERRLVDREGCMVLTERECRERQGLGLDAYSVAVFDRLGGQEQRWPDAVAHMDGRRIAFELEFSPKAPERLWRILHAYNTSGYARVCFLVIAPDVARRVARYIRQHGGCREVFGPRCDLRVEPWWSAPDDVRATVQRAIEEPGELTKHERRW